jgi:DedD protein
MAPALKQRLIGAVVLVALAVIFVPMLLDGSGRDSGDKVSVEIPDEPDPPDPTFDEQTMDTAETPDEGDRGVAATTTSDSADTDATASATASAAPTSDAPDAEPASADSASGEAATTERADETTDTPSSPDSEGGPSAWVVQMGSFGEKTNAVVLRDKLRAADHDAFIEQGSTGDTQVWRVRVGPVATRERADRLKRTLDAERDGESLVMSYPD